MPSPFPGMDPYIETVDVWHDFHVRFVPALADALAAVLPERYIIKADQDVFIHELSADERNLVGRPDVFVASTGQPSRTAPAVAWAGVDTSVAAAFSTAIDVERRPFLQIIDRLRRTVVTAVEVLSPSNKSPSGDRATYMVKRQRLQAGHVNLVELDFLRAGPRLPLEGLPACDYYALVSRATDWPHVRVWPIGLRDPLPTVPIPLADGDPDAMLDLRVPLDHVYDRARYAGYIYQNPLDPPLSPADAAWAAERVAAVVPR